MAQSPVLFLAGLFGLLLLAGTVGTWIWIIYLLSTRQPLVRMEHREPVPWGPAAAIVVALITVSPLLLALYGQLVSPSEVEAATAASVTNIDTFIIYLLIDTGAKLLFCLLVALSLKLAAGATSRDFGLPPESLSRDVPLGAMGYAAIMIPMGLLNLAINTLFEPSSKHPILEFLQTPGPHLLLLWGSSILAAVIVAPLVEEFLFRGILQGYLEKRFGPQSWLPIFFSSAFFAGMHINGDSTDPIPLFFFALVLGYLYRQTHRLWPCIVLHAMLNGTSIFGLWASQQVKEQDSSIVFPSTILHWLTALGS